MAATEGSEAIPCWKIRAKAGNPPGWRQRLLRRVGDGIPQWVK